MICSFELKACSSGSRVIEMLGLCTKEFCSSSVKLSYAAPVQLFPSATAPAAGSCNPSIASSTGSPQRRLRHSEANLMRE